MKLVFLGPPGAGKGTQASRIAEDLGVEHVSSGAIFRAAVREGSQLGRAVQSHLDAGTLAPDELTCRVIEEMVLQRCENYILDGYPRTVPQAQMLDAMLEGRGERLHAVVYLRLEEEVAVERLTGRLVCTQCGENFHRLFMPPRAEGVCDECGGELSVRSDSSEDVVEKRLAEYRQKTRPLVPYYEHRGLLHRVDGAQSPEAVYSDIKALLAGLGT